MFPWSDKSKKSVTFNQDIADESLLEVVETELMKQPGKTFSDLCKEALWQFLCVPQSVRPTFRAANTQYQTTDLQAQLAEFEQRFFARESSRLDAIERQLNQLTQQLAQLALTTTQQPNSVPAPQLDSEEEAVAAATPPNDDPLLSRLSPLLDDF
jgi:hypothetical protein